MNRASTWLPVASSSCWIDASVCMPGISDGADAMSIHFMAVRSSENGHWPQSSSSASM